MSDTGTTAPAPAPAAPSVADAISAQQAGIAAPAPGDVIDKARYDAEVANHIRERSFWRPAQRVYEGLDEDSQQHLMALADAARRGDTAAILDLTMSTAEAVAGQTGQTMADIIAARQGAARTAELGQQAGAPAAAPAAAPTAADIAAAVQEAIRAERTEQSAAAQRATIKAEVETKMTAAGYPLESPPGRAIINYCYENRCAPEVGIAWYNDDLTARGFTRAQAAQAAQSAAAGMAALPGTAPDGQAAAGAAADNLGSRQRAINRIQEHQRAQANGGSVL